MEAHKHGTQYGTQGTVSGPLSGRGRLGRYSDGAERARCPGSGLPVCLLLLCASLAAYAGCSEKSPAAEGKSAERKAVTVTVGPVTLRRDLTRSVDVVGNFQGLEEMIVTPKVGGRVLKINYDVQDVVHTGDILMEIDPIDYQLAVEEARRALTSELAKLNLSKVPEENFDLEGLFPKLPAWIRAHNQETNLGLRVKRNGPLVGTGAVTQEEYEQIQTDYSIAAATRIQAEWDARANMATARLKKALLDTAEQHLADTRVEVPVPKVGTLGMRTGPDGKPLKTEYVVADRMAEIGEMVMVFAFSAKGVFRLVRNDTLKVLATVPERYVSQVKIGQSVRVASEAYPDKVFPGEVKRINPTVDRASRTYQVEVWVQNESRLLKAGGFAKLAIVTDTAAQALTVPVEALVTYAGVNKVFVVRDGKAHVVEVTPVEEGREPGAEGRAWVEITPKNPSELSPGAEVVTSGQTQLAEGSAVQIRTPEKQDRKIEDRKMNDEARMTNDEGNPKSE